jgi:hypothetical protein
VVITTVLGMIVTALCCYTFYIFRTGSAREQSFTDAMKVIRAATEIVASIAERGLPTVRGRLDELESRGRQLEQHQRKIAPIIERISASAPPAATTDPTPPELASEAAMIAARKAARAASAAQ